MAAGVKYRLEAYSFRIGDVYRLDILEDGYIGDIIPKNIGAGHLRLSKSDGIIQKTTLNFSIQADVDFEYKQFFQYDNLKYPVYLYKNGVKIWSGHLVNESYSEDYINPPYDVELTATDGLGFLGNFTFDYPQHQNYLFAIDKCLSKTGLVLGYDVAIDLYEDRMITTSSMLDQIYFNGDIFNGKKCSEVIESLLPFGCILTQKNNRWLIRRSFEDSEKSHHKYTNVGIGLIYAGTAVGETLQTMGDLATGDVYPVGKPLMSLEHAWQSATIQKDFGKKQSFFDNSDFAAGLDSWVDNTEGAAYVVDNNGSYYAKIPGFVAVGENKYIEQSIAVTAAPDTDFIFELQYDALGLDRSTTVQAFFSIQLEIKIQLQLGTQYLTTAGWGTDSTPMKFIMSSSVSAPDWKSLKIITDSLPAGGNLIVRLFQIEHAAFPVRSNSVILGAVFSNIKAYTSEAAEFPSIINYTVPIRNNAAEGNNVVTLKPTDLPVMPNSNLYFANATYIEGGILSETWSNNGGAADVIENIVANQLASYYGTVRQKISGCNWRGAGLSLNSVAQHPKNDNIKFIANDGEWLILEDEFNINWIEIAGSASTTATVESSTNNGSVQSPSTSVATQQIILQPNRLISGGIVTWLYDLTFAVSAASYIIANKYYNSPDSVLTLATADATNPRIDVIVVNRDGEVVVLTGTPGVSPQKPTVNPAEQLEFTFIFVPAAATEPSDISTEIVYDENTEWTASANWVNVTFDGVTSPFSGSKCIDAGETGLLNILTFTSGSTFAETDFSSFSFWLKFKASDAAGFSLSAALVNGSSIVGVMVPVSFDISFLDWQNIAIPIADFNLNGNSFTSVILYWSKDNAATFSGFYMDLIRFQAGVILPPLSDTYVISAEWDAATQKLKIKRNNNKPDIEVEIPQTIAVTETPTGAINSINTTYTLSQTPNLNRPYFNFLNGVYQVQGVNYTLTSNTIEFVTPPFTGDTLITIYEY